MDFGKKALAIFKWIVLVAVFASLGFGADNKKVVVPLYAVFFTLAFVTVYFFTKYFGKSKSKSSNIVRKLKPVIGFALVVAALLVPSFMLKSANFTMGIQAILVVSSLALIGIGFFSVKLINSIKATFSKKFLGYFILTLASIIPGFLMSKYDNSYSSLGTAYYMALLIATFSWWGFSLIASKE